MFKYSYFLIILLLFTLTGCSKNQNVSVNTIQSKQLNKNDVITVELNKKNHKDVIRIDSIPSLTYTKLLKYKNNIFRQGIKQYDLIGQNKRYIALYKGKNVTLINKVTNKVFDIKRYTKKIKIIQDKVFYIAGNNIKILNLKTKKEKNGIGDTYLADEDIVYPVKEGGKTNNLFNFIKYLKKNNSNKQIGEIISKLIGETQCNEVLKLTKKYSLFNITTIKENNLIGSVVAKKCNTRLTSFKILEILDKKYVIADLMINGKVYDNITTNENGTLFMLYTKLQYDNEQKVNILAYINSRFILGLGSFTKQKDSNYPKYIPVMVNTNTGDLNAYYNYDTINLGKYAHILNKEGINITLNKGIK